MLGVIIERRDIIHNSVNRPPALYGLNMEKTHTGEKIPRMGFFIFRKAHTGPLYGCSPSADIERVVYWVHGYRITKYACNSLHVMRYECDVVHNAVQLIFLHPHCTLSPNDRTALANCVSLGVKGVRS